VASVFLWISPALVLAFIVNHDWFWNYAPAWLREYRTDVPWASFIVGTFALIAAWYGGEHFIARQVRALSKAVQGLSRGDLQARTGLGETEGELDQLAHKFDEMAAALQKRQAERDEADRKLLNRAMMQAAVSAVGQCALTSKELELLYDQAVNRVAEMFGVEYAMLFQRLPDGQLQPLAVYGWNPKPGTDAFLVGDNNSQLISAAETGEASVVSDWSQETNFSRSPLLVELGVVSSIAVAIPSRQKPFGVLVAGTTVRREFGSDDVQFMLAMANVIGMATERLRAEAESEKLAKFVKENPNATLELATDGSVNYFNIAAEKLAATAGKTHPRELLPENLVAIIHDCLTHNESRLNQVTKIGGQTISWSFYPVPASGVVHCYSEDVTARLSLEAQLRQSQKMESIGQLAAGVAHDFNNMLTIIQGHSSKMLAVENSLPPDLLEPVLAIYGAAERAAGLTKQLLMFSRKNVMLLRPLDLHVVIGNMNKMLCRLLGENIKLEFIPRPHLPHILGDSGMIEQILMNFAVNARDAMNNSGKLTINVEEYRPAPQYLEHRTDARPGLFVRLQVTDTGSGMTDAIRERIFEPFFTTKEVGKGTGLGLATVFGIVKQHNGWLEVASQVGKGTTFTVYFPASEEAVAEKTEPVAAPKPVTGGAETILVVEDELVLREMARDFLAIGGYRVLEAENGRQAIEVWKQHRGEIDLLLTDMKMPEGVSGMDLAEHMVQDHPELKIIFASGYSDDVVSQEFLTRTGSRFLAKPYTYTDLTRLVRECLDGKEITVAVS
jgi:signal transduction histidine kinase/ActR/RegA family two-component response regulator